jgi:thiol-disulfide isomerase/thioredoxin
MASSILLGVATGFVWAPCAGPVLGLILTGAALRGPGVETSLLLLAYGLGAATALAAGVLFGGRVLAWARLSVRWGEGLRRMLGAAVVAGAVAIWFGADTTLLTALPLTGTSRLEHGLIATLGSASALGLAATTAEASPMPSLSPPLAALAGARQWLNTPPLQAAALRGKVVLVNFWTYSCINCLRTLPYLRAWAEKYKDQGLVVVGVETPEFAFEKDLGNVRTALPGLGVSYPVAIDNDFAIWRAFDNEAWPGFYFVGPDGRIRHRVLGEGQYDESERLIQQLLSEANGAQVAGDTVAVSGAGSQAAPSLQDLRSPETYLGYAQARNFVSSTRPGNDTASQYTPASSLPLNHWSLAGVWTIGAEFATLDKPSGAITYRFHARDLNLVLATADQTGPVRFRVKIDGLPPNADHGADVDADGWGTARQARLYQLVRQSGPVTDRTFEIEFLDPGVRAYSFTFG